MSRVYGGLIRMVDHNILVYLKDRYDRDIYPKLINDEVHQNPSAVDDIITGLISGNKKLRSNCSDIAAIISDEHPGKLYQYIDIFVNNLSSNIPRLKYNAAYTLGNLASVDRTGKIVDQIKPIAQNLSNDSNKIQNNSVRALSKIAAANPGEAERIFNLLISHKKFFPNERITIIIENLENFSEIRELRDDAKKFLEKYIDSSTKSVQSKAMDILRKLSRAN